MLAPIGYKDPLEHGQYCQIYIVSFIVARLIWVNLALIPSTHRCWCLLFSFVNKPLARLVLYKMLVTPHSCQGVRNPYRVSKSLLLLNKYFLNKNLSLQRVIELWKVLQHPRLLLHQRNRHRQNKRRLHQFSTVSASFPQWLLYLHRSTLPGVHNISVISSHWNHTFLWPRYDELLTSVWDCWHPLR